MYKNGSRISNTTNYINPGNNGKDSIKIKNLKKLIEPLKSSYDLILFDCSPSWSVVIKNALLVSDHIISPLGCDVGSYRSVSQNIQRIAGFRDDNSLEWSSFTMIPTLKENSKISSQIEAQYRSEYSEYTSINSVRRTVIGQENSLKFETVFEDSPTSPLSADYYDIIREVWSKIGAVRG